MQFYSKEVHIVSGDDGLTEYKLWVHYNHMAAQVSKDEDNHIIWFDPSCSLNTIKQINTMVFLANRFEFPSTLLVDMLIQMKNYINKPKSEGESDV